VSLGELSLHRQARSAMCLSRFPTTSTRFNLCLWSLAFDMSPRLALAIAMYVSIFFLWWAGAVCALALSLRYRAWEVVLFGALIDMVWLPWSMFHGIPTATITAIILVWALEPLRRQFLFDYD
jgi:hypothetical protein